YYSCIINLYNIEFTTEHDSGGTSHHAHQNPPDVIIPRPGLVFTHIRCLHMACFLQRVDLDLQSLPAEVDSQEEPRRCSTIRDPDEKTVRCPSQNTKCGFGCLSPRGGNHSECPYCLQLG